MVKGLLRFALVSLLTMLLAPQLSRVFDQLVAKAPKNSFLEAFLVELSDRYASSLVHSLGETVGELVLGER